MSCQQKVRPSPAAHMAPRTIDAQGALRGVLPLPWLAKAELATRSRIGKL